METICSYCQKLQSDSASESPEAISHGICRSCLDTIVIGGGKSLEAFLDQFSEPVLSSMETFGSSRPIAGDWLCW